MSKKKGDKPEDQKRQSAPWFEKPEGFDTWEPDSQFNYRMQKLSELQNSPFHRAKEKVGAFVGGCVSDPDFRHPDSAALLDLLLIIRDHLLSDETTTATKAWGIDDYLQPILEEKLAYTRRMKNEKEQAQREAMAKAEKYVKDEWAKVSDQRAHREQFSDRMAKEILQLFEVEKAAGRIRKEWLKGS